MGWQVERLKIGTHGSLSDVLAFVGNIAYEDGLLMKVTQATVLESEWRFALSGATAKPRQVNTRDLFHIPYSNFGVQYG